jgi:gluconolactonase
MYHGEVEGTGFVSYDKRFGQLYAGHVRIERLWTGARWCEGPVWFAAGRTLVWSDIPNNRMMRLVEPSHDVSVFRENSHNSNGNTVDLQGRLVSCEHQSRRVTMTGFDGKIVTLADKYQGKRLNSPNDAVVKSDGSIWFTDPAYGIDADYEGDRQPRELDGCYVFRIDPRTGEIAAVITDMVRPNGIAFSPDEQFLYVADTGVSHQQNGPKHIRKFKVSADGKSVSGGEVFADCTVGLFDGFRFDIEGRLWTSAGDGVHVYAPDGVLLGKFLIPEIVANVTFGGAKLNRLYICGTTSIYSLFTFTTGAGPG